jgi:hypothetical protein
MLGNWGRVGRWWLSLYGSGELLSWGYLPTLGTEYSVPYFVDASGTFSEQCFPLREYSFRVAAHVSWWSRVHLILSTLPT